MKKILLSGLFLSVLGGLSAQTFVSTAPGKKNVVLEEFTGWACQWCPDGHDRAKLIQDNYPGRVVLINIHAGGFANPTGGAPDYRTVEGDAIDNYFSPSGYPAGTVNRVGGSVGRGEWQTRATAILGEDSPVNAAVRATYDAANNEVDIEVEVYYTDSSQVANTNKLNVYILQSDIVGPQIIAGSLNPTQLLPNGDYNHQHMLRAMLTGTWGEDIVNPGAGTFISKTYSWPLPADIRGVDVLVQNLEVAVSVAEDQENIFTGDVVEVDIDPALLTDLSINNATATPTNYCAADINPSVIVTNLGTSVVTSFKIDADVNGNIVTETYTGSLGNGQSHQVNFPVVNLTSGQNTVNFSAPYDINGGALLDSDVLNGITSSVVVLNVPTNPITPDQAYDFNISAIAELPSNLFEENPNDVRMFTVNQSITSAVTWNLGGFGNSDGCMRWDFFDIAAGEEAAIFTEKFDLTDMAQGMITFSRAYAQYSTENDRFEVLASTDCGETWNLLYSKAGADLATAPVVTTRFYPTVSQWASDTVSINAYAGASEVIFKFNGVSEYGNSLYIDDINIDRTVVTSVSELTQAGLSIYPNPTTGIINITKPADAAAYNYQIVDVAGKVVAQGVGRNNVETLDLDLNSGMYFVQISVNEKVYSQKLVIE